MKNNFLAYLLWLPPFGFLGLHKAYLGNPLMAVIYFLTGGGCFFGWASDLFTLPKQVREANLKDILEARDYLHNRLGYDIPHDEAEEAKLRRLIVEEVHAQLQKEPKSSPEKAVLRLAFEKRGRITVGDVASIDTERCFGCGNCALTCPEGALHLEEVRPLEHIRVA